MVDEKRPLKHMLRQDWVVANPENKTDAFTAQTSLFVKETGYYCLRLANPNSGSLSVKLDFVNPYGKMPPEFHPLLKVNNNCLLLKIGFSNSMHNLWNWIAGLDWIVN
jgi:hypothetical protein